MSCTPDEIKEQIKLSFGGPVFCVELTDEMLDGILALTTRWWIQAVGGQQMIMFKQFGSREVTFQLGDDVEDVQNVVFQQSLPFQFSYPELFDTAIPWPGAFTSVLGGPTVASSLGNMPYTGLVQALQSIDQSRRIVSADRDWTFLKTTKALRVFPTTIESGTIGIEYLSNNLQFQSFSADECTLYYEWAHAEAMEILGRQRTKFGSFPVPGGERTLDGATLLADAKEEKTRLRDFAIDRFKPGFFFAE